MKKLLLAAAVATATFIPSFAQETVKTLYSGEPVNVTWENTLKIDAADFSEGVSTGNYLYITFSTTTDVIEVKANGTWLPGSRFTFLGDNATDFRLYLTDAGLAAAKEYGIEICGADFTVKSVTVMNDGFSMPEGAIWGGYFWVESWNTLELFKTALANYAGERYMDIYLSADNGDNTSYFVKVLTAWENPDAILADNGDIEHLATKAVVDLKDIDIQTALTDVDKLMIQSNPEGGNPYNITAIALRADNGTQSAISSVISGNDTFVNVYNLQGMAVKTAVSAADATAGLPSGLYIVNGKKIYVK